MKLILRLIFFILFVIDINTSWAQLQPPISRVENVGNRQEKIQALYVAYITQQLSLTPEEAQRFWPIHTQFKNELKAVKLDMPELDKQQLNLNIKKKYQDKFNTILGAERCDRFYKMDGEFAKKLLQQIRKQRPNNNMQQPLRMRNRQGL